MKSWLKKRWLAFEQSYDRAEAVAASQPAFVAGTVVAMALVFVVIAYLLGAQFQHPWISLLLTLVGGALSLFAWSRSCQGTAGALATLLDTGFYSAALTYAATSTDGDYAIGVAIAHGLMVMAFQAPSYGLTLPFALTLLLPLVLGLLNHPATAVALILIATYLMAMLMSFMSARRRELLRERQKLTQAVDAASKVADDSVQAALATTLLSLGHFLHELRNFQTAMRANLNFIEMQATLDEDAREALADALEAQAGEEKLVTETIASLTQRAKPPGERFLLGDLLVEVADDGVILRERTERPFAISGSIEQLRGVLGNLIRNAHQAGATRIHLEARLEPSGHAVELTVQDDGPGIPQALRGEIFEPFVSRGKAAGTGLGLYLCRRYLELFGGTIRVTDSPLGGAAFVIRLPGQVQDTEPLGGDA